MPLIKLATPKRIWLLSLAFLAIGIPTSARAQSVRVDEAADIQFISASHAEACGCGGHRCGLFCAGSNSLLPVNNRLDHFFETILSPKEHLHFPLEVGGWHWFPIDATGAGTGGYGTKGIRGTYAWTLRGGPEYQLDESRSAGAYAFFALRDDDAYRTYYPSNYWFLDAYAWYRDEHYGRLRAGLITKKFGLDGYGNFTGTAPYFEGFIQDPDYGVAWDQTWDAGAGVSIETHAQFFFHEDGKNGSLRGFDSESTIGVHEKNTFVLRNIASWSNCENASTQLGASFLVGEIDSRVAGFADDTRTAWGVDVTRTLGDFSLRGEFIQRFGRVVPAHIASGGPSNRLETWSVEPAYRVGCWTWRGKYSQSFLSNPFGRFEDLSLGGQLDITSNIHFFAEYVWLTVDNHASLGDFTILEGPQLTVYWHY